MIFFGEISATIINNDCNCIFLLCTLASIVFNIDKSIIKELNFTWLCSAENNTRFFCRIVNKAMPSKSNYDYLPPSSWIFSLVLQFSKFIINKYLGIVCIYSLFVLLIKHCDYLWSKFQHSLIAHIAYELYIIDFHIFLQKI